MHQRSGPCGDGYDFAEHRDDLDRLQRAPAGMPILTAFVRQFPLLRLTTRGGPSFELADAVARGELDVAAISQVAPDSRFSSCGCTSLAWRSMAAKAIRCCQKVS